MMSVLEVLWVAGGLQVVRQNLSTSAKLLQSQQALNNTNQLRLSCECILVMFS
jgi:hypothetical protein